VRRRPGECRAFAPAAMEGIGEIDSPAEGMSATSLTYRSPGTRSQSAPLRCSQELSESEYPIASNQRPRPDMPINTPAVASMLVMDALPEEQRFGPSVKTGSGDPVRPVRN
jgi:hypothetical protein